MNYLQLKMDISTIIVIALRGPIVVIHFQRLDCLGVGRRTVPAVIRPLVEVLGPSGVEVLSENVGFVFFPECGVNVLGFIDFPATQLRGSP
jgi:hypothetical protein